jgi:hypothetical protein
VTAADAAVKGEMGMAGSDETSTPGPPGSYEVRLGVPEDVGSDPDALLEYLTHLAEDMSESERVLIASEHGTGAVGAGGRAWVDITVTVFGGGHCPGRVPGTGEDEGAEEGDDEGDGNGDGDVRA